MDVEQVRTLLRRLPHVEETMQWGANLVYWVGDKAIGGKMFALVNLDEDRNPEKPTPVMAFHAGPERFPELLETEGVVPAPYMARIYWVALRDWNVLRGPELKQLLLAAHTDVEARLPKKVQALLALPAAERDRLVIARRKLLAEKTAQAKKPARKTKARLKK